MVSLSNSDLFNTNYSVRTAALHNQNNRHTVNKSILLHRIVNINTYCTVAAVHYTVNSVKLIHLKMVKRNREGRRKPPSNS
jgi:hypothetical protein